MKIQKLRRTVQRPVGIVASDTRVIGEWYGERWDDVPPSARLYANGPEVMRAFYERGECVARRWLRDGRAYGALTGWEWTHPRGSNHVVYSLRRAFNDCTPEELLEAMMTVCAFLRPYGVNIGSPAGMMRSLMLATLAGDLFVRDYVVPLDRLWHGARIERRPGLQHEFHDATLWDLTAAYPSALIETWLPTRAFKHYVAKPHEHIPDQRVGFAEALVYVPKELRYGPLPDSDWIRPRMLFPVDEALTGVWTFDELHAAERAGCTVNPIEYWTAHQVHDPFRAFGVAYKQLRSLGRLPLRIVKQGGNAAIGTLQQHGRQQFTAWRNGSEVIIREGSEAHARAQSLHALITGSVRARLYDEAIRPNVTSFVSCHTDGAILLGWPKLSDRWRVKRSMPHLYLFDAQRYAYYDDDGILHHATAGMPPERAEVWLTRKRQGLGFPYREPMVS